MKLIVLSLLMTTSAFASYLQITCSNTDGSVKYHSGHSLNGVEIKKFDHQTGEEISSQMYSISSLVSNGNSAKVKIKKLNTINIEEDKNCSSNGYGTYSRTETSVNKIGIFLIADHIKIDDFFICKFYVNNTINCQ